MKIPVYIRHKIATVLMKYEERMEKKHNVKFNGEFAGMYARIIMTLEVSKKTTGKPEGR